MLTLTPMTPTATYRTRNYAYERLSGLDLADGRLTLKVQRGPRTLDTTYALQCERDETGFLHTVYLAKERSEDGEVYGIEFSLRGACRCSCIGHSRHAQCKHADAVRDLLRKGQLEEVRPEDDVPQQTERHDEPARLGDAAERTVAALLGNEVA